MHTIFFQLDFILNKSFSGISLNATAKEFVPGGFSLGGVNDCGTLKKSPPLLSQTASAPDLLRWGCYNQINASFHFFRSSNSPTPNVDDILRTQGDACSENSNNSNSGCDVVYNEVKASETNVEKRRMRSSPELLHPEGRLKEERVEERRCGRYERPRCLKENICRSKSTLWCYMCCLCHSEIQIPQLLHSTCGVNYVTKPSMFLHSMYL